MVQTIYIVHLFDDMHENTLYTGCRKTKEEAKELAKQLGQKLTAQGFKRWDHDFKIYYCGETLETWSYMDDLESRDIWLDDSCTLQTYDNSVWPHDNATPDEVIFFGPEGNKVFPNIDAAFEWMKEQENNSTFKL